MMRHAQKAIISVWPLPILFLLLFSGAAVSADQDSWEGVERVVAIGDVHGDYEQFVAVLRSAQLIDSKEAWSGGKTHLVQTGDILDRGPDSRKVMDLLMKLEKEARRAGGWVHCLIGNHEAMNVYGDLRYVSPGEFAAFRVRNSEKARAELYKEHQEQIKSSSSPDKVPAFDDAFQRTWEAEHPLGYAEHRREFGPSGKYGKWIRSHNAVIKIDNTLFLHGGIGPKYVDLKLQMINDRSRDELEEFTKLQGGIVMDSDGPLWYRGLAQGDEKALEPHVKAVLKAHQADRIVIGHTPTDGAILPRFDGKVVLIDVGLSRVFDPRPRLACLLIEKGKPYALHRGKKLELPSDSSSGLLNYLKQAAALDPSPSSLEKRIAEIEARAPAPVPK
jgi:calcineurin-like phosphoesterase family protein